MDAGTLNCPSCGAAAASDATQCRFCGSRLATIACPKCFGMIFAGSEFCQHCGAKIPRRRIASEGPAGDCPRCDAPLRRAKIGETRLCLCDRCNGIWIDAESFEEICEDQRRERAVLIARLPPPLPQQHNRFSRRFYLKCPACAQIMNRMNFAHCSGTIVDVCKTHGLWFDRDELRRVVEFIKGGGIERCETISEHAESARRSQQLEANQTAAQHDANCPWLVREDLIDRIINAVGTVMGF